MKPCRSLWMAVLALLIAGAVPGSAQPCQSSAPAKSPTKVQARKAGKIVLIVPPEQGFFSKRLDYEGIPIKAHADVADEALYAARERLALLLKHLPTARRNLAAAGAEVRTYPDLAALTAAAQEILLQQKSAPDQAAGGPLCRTGYLHP